MSFNIKYDLRFKHTQLQEFNVVDLEIIFLQTGVILS